MCLARNNLGHAYLPAQRNEEARREFAFALHNSVKRTTTCCERMMKWKRPEERSGLES